mmetsp:Transcript_5165/g.8965  ORF Transcript_5165/g.8965 Transcript_5165/m.8965 type:complete len:155 (+) Transcript_5165:200-664(+)
MAPSEVTLKFGAESQVFELEPGGELNALAIKDCFGLQTVKLDGKVVSVNQSNGLTYRTFQHGETISVEGTAGVGSADFKALQDQVAAQGHEVFLVRALTNNLVMDYFFAPGKQPFSTSSEVFQGRKPHGMLREVTVQRLAASTWAGLAVTSRGV